LESVSIVALLLCDTVLCLCIIFLHQFPI
jgi:hypothetical protein